MSLLLSSFSPWSIDRRPDGNHSCFVRPVQNFLKCEMSRLCLSIFLKYLRGEREGGGRAGETAKSYHVDDLISTCSNGRDQRVNSVKIGKSLHFRVRKALDMHSSVSSHRTRTSSDTVISSTGPRTAAAPALSSASAEPSSLSPSFSDSDQLIVTMRIVDAQSASTALPYWRLADLGVRRRVGRQVPSLLARSPSVRPSV